MKALDFIYLYLSLGLCKSVCDCVVVYVYSQQPNMAAVGREEGR